MGEISLPVMVDLFDLYTDSRKASESLRTERGSEGEKERIGVRENEERFTEGAHED